MVFSAKPDDVETGSDSSDTLSEPPSPSSCSESANVNDTMNIGSDDFLAVPNLTTKQEG